jgi:hypothetical protein
MQHKDDSRASQKELLIESLKQEGLPTRMILGVTSEIDRISEGRPALEVGLKPADYFILQGLLDRVLEYTREVYFSSKATEEGKAGLLSRLQMNLARKGIDFTLVYQIWRLAEFLKEAPDNDSIKGHISPGGQGPSEEYLGDDYAAAVMDYVEMKTSVQVTTAEQLQEGAGIDKASAEVILMLGCRARVYKAAVTALNTGAAYKDLLKITSKLAPGDEATGPKIIKKSIREAYDLKGTGSWAAWGQPGIREVAADLEAPYSEVLLSYLEGAESWSL